MKQLKSISLAAVTLLFILASCKSGNVKPIEGISQGQLDSASYAIGLWFGNYMKSSGIGELNMNQVWKGVEDQSAGEQKLEESQIYEILNNYMVIRRAAESEFNLKEGEAFLAENKNQEGVITLESGLQYKVLQEGNGTFPAATDTVEVNYTGQYINGEVFDSSEKQGASATFSLAGGVIPGWTEGLQYASEGGKIMLYIPTSLAYADTNPYVKPNATIIFEVELLKVKKFQATEEVQATE